MMNIQNWPTITFTFSIPENTEKSVSFIANQSTRKRNLLIDWGDDIVTTSVGGSDIRHTYTASGSTRLITVTIKGYLEGLSVEGLELTTLDVSGSLSLKRLFCRNNKLTRLDVSKQLALTQLYCSRNELTTLNLSDTPALKMLYCDHNQLTTLDLSDSKNLERLFCEYNQLTLLDVSNNPALLTISSYQNPFKLISGISGYKRTIDSYELGETSGDYDFTNCTFTSDNGDLAIKTDGIVKVNASINRTRKYDSIVGNSGISSWAIQAKEVQVYFQDGTVISQKHAFYEKIAQIVREEELYEYPQLCKILTPKWGLQETRDNYAIHKTLVCDSKQRGLWQNGRGVFGLETSINNIDWTPSYTIGYYYQMTSKRFELVVAEKATFYIININNETYILRENGQRVVCVDGNLQVFNGAQIVSQEYDNSTKQTKYVIQMNSDGNQYVWCHLFEDKYIDAEDPYETRIITIKEIATE